MEKPVNFSAFHCFGRRLACILLKKVQFEKETIVLMMVLCGFYVQDLGSYCEPHSTHCQKLLIFIRFQVQKVDLEYHLEKKIGLWWI